MIDIDNEEQILRMCDFDYFYDSYECSRELCMFYNDILKMKPPFDKRQARIDLGRIGITLNRQSAEINRLKKLLETERVIKTQQDNKLKKAEHDRDRYKNTINEIRDSLLSKAIQITGTSVDSVRLYSINEVFNKKLNELKKEKQ